MEYKISKEIGRGGFGKVERALGSDGNKYAIKTLVYPPIADADRATFRRRFEREVRYQSQIDHPNVVQIIDHNLGEDPPWFVMPLANGSLAEELEADRTLGGDPRVPLFDILAGLEALHEKGFCHRDLKPANVLRFDNEDGTVTYKISDFGLTTPGIGQASTLTKSNMGGGTVLYRPPECAVNFKRATSLADIYSFGAILHDIFAGAPGRIPHSELHVPGLVGPIVERCTKNQPRRRYRSVAALREALYEVLAEGEIEFVSQEEEDVIALLKSEQSISDDDWDKIFNMIDDNEDRGMSNDNILRALSLQHIHELHDAAPDMFHGLGEIYAQFAKSRSFNFDYCDVISDKAQIFYDLGDLQLKAEIAIAMLDLGTSHNRWRVEWQFMRMAGAEIEEALAERIRIEIQVQSVQFSRQIRHLERSIGASRGGLHPILQGCLEGADS